MKRYRLIAPLSLPAFLSLAACGTSPAPLYVEVQKPLPVKFQPSQESGKSVEVKVTGKHGSAVMSVNGHTAFKTVLPESERDSHFSSAMTIPLPLIGGGQSWGGRAGDLIELRQADANWLFYGDQGVVLRNTGAIHPFRLRNPAALKTAVRKNDEALNAFIRSNGNARTEESKQKAAAVYGLKSAATAPAVVPAKR